MDRYVLGFIWFLSLMGALFYGHEIAMLKTERELRQVYEARIVDNNKLENCQKIIANNH